MAVRGTKGAGHAHNQTRVRMLPVLLKKGPLYILHKINNSRHMLAMKDQTLSSYKIQKVQATLACMYSLPLQPWRNRYNRTIQEVRELFKKMWDQIRVQEWGSPQSLRHPRLSSHKIITVINKVSQIVEVLAIKAREIVALPPPILSFLIQKIQYQDLSHLHYSSSITLQQSVPRSFLIRWNLWN